jgi:hypothetical protein
MTEELWALQPVPDSDASMFIQWKGTELCVDFYCPCGHHGHYDGGFAYFLLCPNCETTYELGTQVRVRKVTDVTPGDPAVGILD